MRSVWVDPPLCLRGEMMVGAERGEAWGSELEAAVWYEWEIGSRCATQEGVS